jgi:DNA gyrase/topoisomerase IV subunit A
LLQAIDQIDKVIKCVRAAASKVEALAALMAKPFKFTKNQAEAILEMRLRQLTNLDSTALTNEKYALWDNIEWLKEHISSQSKREAYMLKEIKEIGVRHGEKTRSEIIEAPEKTKLEKGVRQTPAIAKPRFLKIDMKRGIVTQEKGPRGAIPLERNDKLITVTADGTLRKLPATFKGTLASAYSEVKLAKRENEVITRRYLTVFTLENTLKVMVLDGKDLARATSKGKNILPEGATLVHFGEDSFTVTYKSARKKPMTLNLDSKQGKPGGKGIKVSKLDEILL